MVKLLKSELKRLFKNKFFILSFIAIIILNLIRTEIPLYISSYPAEYLPLYALYASLFTLLFVGKLFRERTANNFLAHGVTKTQLFLTEIIVSAVISFFFTLPNLLFFAAEKLSYSDPFESVYNYYTYADNGEFLRMISDHGISFIGMLAVLFALLFLMTFLCACLSVSISMIFHSDIKSIIAYMLVVSSMFAGYVLYEEYNDYFSLPYILNDETANCLTHEGTELDINPYDTESFLKIPEFSLLERNPEFVGGIKRKIIRGVSNSSVAVQLFHISETGVIFNEGKVITGDQYEKRFFNVNGGQADCYLTASPKTPLKLLSTFRIEYCIAAVSLLNLFGLALFRKSDIS